MGLDTAAEAGLLVIDTGRRNRSRTDHYFVERIACRDLAYSLVKCAPSVNGTDNEEVAYSVNLSRRSRDCKGWVRRGTCEHLAACCEAFDWYELPV
jgi:hypothetical protein